MRLGLKYLRIAACLSLLALAACGGGATAGKVTVDWLTNPQEAFQDALQQNRPVFIAFVGMDWSAPSQGIMDEVFNTQTFKDFADKNLVLLRVDLAREPASPQTAQISEKLAESMQVDGLPACLLVDPAHHTLIGRFNGYGVGGPGSYLQELTMRIIQWQDAMAQLPPGATLGAPPLSAPPPGAPLMTGVPQTAPPTVQAVAMPSSLSLAPAGSPGSSSLPTPEQLLQQMQQQPQPVPIPAPATTDQPLLDASPLK
jgi:hypothetical protein